VHDWSRTLRDGLGLIELRRSGVRTLGPR